MINFSKFALLAVLAAILVAASTSRHPGANPTCKCAGGTPTDGYHEDGVRIERVPGQAEDITIRAYVNNVTSPDCTGNCAPVGGCRATISASISAPGGTTICIPLAMHEAQFECVNSQHGPIYQCCKYFNGSEESPMDPLEFDIAVETACGSPYSWHLGFTTDAGEPNYVGLFEIKWAYSCIERAIPQPPN